MAETAKERVIAAHGSLSASINTRMLSVGSFEVTIGHAEVFGVGVGVTESIAERLAWDNAASTLPPTAAEPSEPKPTAKEIFGVEPYSPSEAVTHACGLLDVIKQEWGEVWSEHDQKVRAGLSAILMNSDLLRSVRKEADGFDEWWFGTKENIPFNLLSYTQQVEYNAGKMAWVARGESGVRKGMQRALEACKGERVEFHEDYIALKPDDVAFDDDDATYSRAIRDCEAAILAAMEECK